MKGNVYKCGDMLPHPHFLSFFPIHLPKPDFHRPDFFGADNVRRDSTHIELILPDPRIVLTSSRIDHNEIKEYVALMRSNFSEEELQSYEMQGREVIIHDIANSDITERARQSAANAIVPILRQLGYKPQNITISFRKKFSTADVEGIISSSSVENKGNATRR